MSYLQEWLKNFCDEGYSLWKELQKNRSFQLGKSDEEKKSKKWKEAEEEVKSFMENSLGYVSQLSPGSRTAFDVWGVGLHKSPKEFVHIYLLQVKYGENGDPKLLSGDEWDQAKKYVPELKQLYLVEFLDNNYFPFKKKIPVIISGGYIGVTDVDSYWETVKIKLISRHFVFDRMTSKADMYIRLVSKINHIHTINEFEFEY